MNAGGPPPRSSAARADEPEVRSVLAAARASGLLPARRPVVVMLSGGRDSTCLLDAAATLAGRGEVTALHVNHGLRPEAGDDEEHCVELCERLGLPLVVERLGPAPATGNLHAWARKARYAAAGSLTGAIATGHTATDQVETILYRLAASPGRRALLGMAAREGRVVRPLLEATREQTAAYCEARGLPWREDPANDDPSYRRARARNELVPALRRLHPAAEANVVRTAKLLREEAEVLDALVDEILGGREEIELARLRSLPRALARLVVRRLAELVLEARAPRVARRADDVLTLGDDAALDLGDSARARVRRGVLTFERTPERSERWAARNGEPADSPDPGTRRYLDSLPVRDPAIGEILVQADELRNRVRELGVQITQDYADRDLVLVGVLKGAVFFLSDLMRAIDVPCEVDFMAVASYGSATDSSGVVRILKDLDAAIEGRDVLIVEDIVDSGLTLQYLLRALGARQPASLEVCALLTKPERRKVDLPTRYVGFEIPNRFAIGYGLDHGERFRNLPYVAALGEASEGSSGPDTLPIGP